MKNTMLATLALAGLLSGCATLHSSSKNWKLPGGLGKYTLTARMDLGFLTRTATISVNGREVLTGSAPLWSDQIAMAGQVDGFPINGVCIESQKTCDVTIANFHAGTLKF